MGTRLALLPVTLRRTQQAATEPAMTLLLALGMTVTITLDGCNMGLGTVTHLAEACDNVEGLFGEDLGPSNGCAMIAGDNDLYITVNPYTGRYEGVILDIHGTFVTPVAAG